MLSPSHSPMHVVTRPVASEEGAPAACLLGTHQLTLRGPDVASHLQASAHSSLCCPPLGSAETPLPRRGSDLHCLSPRPLPRASPGERLPAALPVSRDSEPYKAEDRVLSTIVSQGLAQQHRHMLLGLSCRGGERGGRRGQPRPGHPRRRLGTTVYMGSVTEQAVRAPEVTGAVSRALRQTLHPAKARA